jgi:hypothetical protein
MPKASTHILDQLVSYHLTLTRLKKAIDYAGYSEQALIRRSLNRQRNRILEYYNKLIEESTLPDVFVNVIAAIANLWNFADSLRDIGMKDIYEKCINLRKFIEKIVHISYEEYLMISSTPAESLIQLSPKFREAVKDFQGAIISQMMWFSNVVFHQVSSLNGARVIIANEMTLVTESVTARMKNLAAMLVAMLDKCGKRFEKHNLNCMKRNKRS